jgi:flagellar motor switch protein FliG
MSTIWEIMETINSNMLAGYLKVEYPQTVAVILTRLSPKKCGEVLALLPENFAMEVVMRIARIETIKPEIINKIAGALERELIGGEDEYNTIGILQEAFKHMDVSSRNRFLTSIQERNRELALHINKSYVNMNDVQFFPKEKIEQLIAKCDKEKLFVALIGASSEVRDVFMEYIPELALIKNIDLDEISLNQNYVFKQLLNE